MWHNGQADDDKIALEPIELAGSLIGDHLVISLRDQGLDRPGSLEMIGEAELLEQVVDSALRVGGL